MYALFGRSEGQKDRSYISSANTKVDADFRDKFNEYLGDLEWSKVRSLDEVIQFNKDNAAEELPSGQPPTCFSVDARVNT